MSETDVTERPTAIDLDEKYFQPLRFEGIYGRVYSLFVRKWFLFLTVTTAMHLVMIGSVLLLFFFIVGDVTYAYVHEEMVGSEVFLAITIELIVFLAVPCIADGASIRAVAEIYAGKDPSIWGCIQASARKVISLIGSSIMVAFCILLPLLPMVWWIVEGGGEQGFMLFLFFLYCFILFPAYVIGLSIYTHVMYAAVIVENESPIGGLTRSISLVKDNFCDVFCVLFVFGIGRFIITLLLSRLTGGSHYTVHNRLLSYSQNIYNASNDDFGDYYYDPGDMMEEDSLDNDFDTETVKFDFNMGGPGDDILKLIFAIVLGSLGSIFQAVIYFNLVVKKEGWTSSKVAERLCLDGYDVIHGHQDNVVV